MGLFFIIYMEKNDFEDIILIKLFSNLIMFVFWGVEGCNYLVSII